MRFGIEPLIKWGLWSEVVVCILSAVLTEIYFDLGLGMPFVLQGIIYIGNGIVLPNSIAGAVSIRPHAAGTASGIAGFMQMGGGALITQFTGWVLIGASTALPMTLTMVAGSLAGCLGLLRLLGREAAGIEHLPMRSLPGTRRNNFPNGMRCSCLKQRTEVTSMLSTILIVILILLLVGSLPTWPYSRGWGYCPGGGIGLILIIVIILAVSGRICTFWPAGFTTRWPL